MAGKKRERESVCVDCLFSIHSLSFAFALVGSKVWSVSRHSSIKREEQDRREKRQRVPRTRKRGHEDP